METYPLAPSLNERYIRTTRARLTAATAPAPAPRSAVPHAERVAPVVKTSSTTAIRSPARAQSGRKAPRTLRRRAAWSRPRWGRRSGARPEQLARRHAPPPRQVGGQHLRRVIPALDRAPAVGRHPRHQIALRPRDDGGDDPRRRLRQRAQAGVLEAHHEVAAAALERERGDGRVEPQPPPPALAAVGDRLGGRLATARALRAAEHRQRGQARGTDRIGAPGRTARTGPG